jgi:anti-anti-sigma factor
MLEYRSEDDKFLCIFDGRIDTIASREIEDELIDKVQHSKLPVVFDFSKLEYVASSFLRVCVKVARVAGATKIKVLNPSTDILHIFKMTGFDKLMEMENEEGY